MKLRLKHLRIAAVALALPLSLYGYLNGDSLSAYYYGRIGSNNSGGISSILTVGTNNIANGPQSAAIGNSLQNYQPNNLTVGQYNTPVTGDLFTVGNGSGLYDPVTGTTNRSNALSVTTDSTVNIPGTADINSIPAQGGIDNFTGTPPAWWSTAPYKIFSTETQGGSDNSSANIGQLKHVASLAKAYLDFHLKKLGGAGTAINTMCAFSNDDNFAPVAVGQLKNVAKLFYVRLDAVDGSARPLPWSGTSHPQNAAPITIGQLKRAFAFQFSTAFMAQNPSSMGLYWWQTWYVGSTTGSFDLTDSDSDGLSKLQEDIAGTDHTNPDSDNDYALDAEELEEGTNPWSQESAPLRLCWLHDDTSLGMNYRGPNPLPWETNYYSENFFKVDTRAGVLQYGGRGDFPVGGVLGVIDFAAQRFPVPPYATTELTAWNFPQFTPDDRVGRSHVEVKTEGDDHYNTQTVHLWLRGPKSDSSVTRTFLKRVKRTMHNNIGFGLEVDISPPDEPYQIMTFTIPPNSNKSSRQWFRLIQSTTMGPAPVVTPLPKLDYREYVDAYLVPVEVQSVTFSGSGASEFFTVKADDGTDFAAPHWKDTGGDENLVKTDGDHTYPVAYVRNKIPLVAATIKLTPGLAGLRIKASHTDGFSMTTAPLTVPASGIVEIPATSLTQPLPNTVFHYPAFKLTWEISINGGAWSRIGESKNPLYVLRRPPLLGVDQLPGAVALTEMRYTLVHTSCTLAHGETADDAIVSAVNTHFIIWNAKRLRYDAQKGTAPGAPEPIYYYKNWETSDRNNDIRRINTLLARPWGVPSPICQCYVFAEMLRDMLKIQGIPATAPVIIYNWDGDIPFRRFLVKHWTFSGTGNSGVVGWPYKQDSPNEYEYIGGTVGQNNEHCPGVFDNHCLLGLADGRFYDPSYGSGPYQNLTTHEWAAFSGYERIKNGLLDPPSAARKNTEGLGDTRASSYR